MANGKAYTELKKKSRLKKGHKFFDTINRWSNLRSAQWKTFKVPFPLNFWV